MAKPDAVLFNGGFCIPAIARERITEAIANWFGGGGAWRPKILSNEHMSSAVAIGAAYYGRVRRGAGGGNRETDERGSGPVTRT
jgi:hypothetical protein